MGQAAALEGRRTLVEVERGAAEIAPIIWILDEAGLAVESLDLVQPELHDVFVAKRDIRSSQARGTKPASKWPAPRTRGTCLERTGTRDDHITANPRVNAALGGGRSSRPSAAHS